MKGILLDLLFIDTKTFIGEMVIGGCLGHSDHQVVDFQIVSDRGKTAINTSTLAMGRADFWLLKDLVSKVPWESTFEGIGVHESWLLFKSHLLRVWEQPIPKCG